MDRATNSTAPADRLFCAVELSKNSWLLGIQFPDRQKASVYPIQGGDSEGLMTKLVAACDRWTKVSGKKPSIILCYEAGYDAFWLARFLSVQQPATDCGLSGIGYEPLSQRPGGALPGDLARRQWSRAGNDDPDSLAVDPTSAQERDCPVVRATDRRAERAH